MDEIEKIKEMRASGMTLAEIANKLNKSISYVYSRLDKKYMPKKLKVKNYGN